MSIQIIITKYFPNLEYLLFEPLEQLASDLDPMLQIYFKKQPSICFGIP